MEQTSYSPYRWVILIIICLTGLNIIGGISSFQVLLPGLSQKLGLTAEQTIPTIVWFTWGLWIGMGLGTFIIPRAGIKNTLLLGLILLAVPQFIIPYTNSLSLIVVLRFIQGLVSIGIPVMFAYVAGMGWFPPKEAGIAAGIFIGVLSAGAFFGGGVAGAFLSYGVHVSMLVIAAFIVVMFFACLFGLKTPAVAAQPQAAKTDTAQPPKKIEASGKSIPPKLSPYKMKETWLMVLLLHGICYAYWGLPIIWPTYASQIKSSTTEFGTLLFVIGIMGFVAVLGGIWSDAWLRKSGNVSGARLGPIFVSLIITLVGIVAAMFVTTPSALIVTAIFAGIWNMGLPVYWTLLGVIYPPDPELVGKSSSLMTFLGNSPLVFILPLSLWIAKTSSWSMAFGVMAVLFILFSFPSLYFLRKVILEKQASKS